MKKTFILSIAIACHEANRIYCQSHGDNSQKTWSEAEEWQKESAIKGVEFRLNNPTAGHDAQHNSWMDEKIRDGWMYGEVKDPIAKTHPCMVSFEKLPIMQQKKDALFCAIVDAYVQNKPNKNLSFGEACEAAKKGQKVARAGWNGIGMYAYIVPSNKYPAVTEVAKQEFGEMVPYREYWALKTAQNDIATWAPSGSDSLAEDWIIVE